MTLTIVPNLNRANIIKTFLFLHVGVLRCRDIVVHLNSAILTCLDKREKTGHFNSQSKRKKKNITTLDTNKRKQKIANCRHFCATTFNENHVPRNEILRQSWLVHLDGNTWKMKNFRCTFSKKLQWNCSWRLGSRCGLSCGEGRIYKLITRSCALIWLTFKDVFYEGFKFNRNSIFLRSSNANQVQIKVFQFSPKNFKKEICPQGLFIFHTSMFPSHSHSDGSVIRWVRSNQNIKLPSEIVRKSREALLGSTKPSRNLNLNDLERSTVVIALYFKSTCQLLHFFFQSFSICWGVFFSFSPQETTENGRLKFLPTGQRSYSTSHFASNVGVRLKHSIYEISPRQPVTSPKVA